MVESIRQLWYWLGLRDIWRFHISYVPTILHPVPIICAALAGYLFGGVGQMHEIYLSAIEADDRYRFLLGLVCIALLCAALYSAFLVLTDRHATVIYGSMAEVQLPVWLVLARYLIAVGCGMAPLIGLGYGLWKVQTQLADTIRTAAEATSQVVAPSALAISINDIIRQAAIALTSPATYVWPGLIVFCVAALVVILRNLRIGPLAFIQASWRDVALYSAIVTAVTVSVAVLFCALPERGEFDLDKGMHLTSLQQHGLVYLASVILFIPAVGSMLWIWRESNLAKWIIVLSCSAIAFAALLVLPALPPTKLLLASQAIGPTAMSAIQVLTIFTLLMALYMLGRYVNLPLIIILVIAVFTKTWFTEPAMAPDKGDLILKSADLTDKSQAVEHYSKWMAQRQTEVAKYAKLDRDYPVYIIAVQGGGIYAASAAASFLARLQDICPNFSRHVFAISGVSGGSVGASLFNASLADRQGPAAQGCEALDAAKPAKAFSDRMRNVMTRDHLSPVLARLTPEYADRLFMGLVGMLQRHLPFVGSREPLNRSSALEASLSCAMFLSGQPVGVNNQPCGEADIKAGMGEYKNHHTVGGSRPALLLNTTFVETGQRVAFSPFGLSDLGERSLRAFSDLKPARVNIPDEKLATAAVASARFPVLMSAYSLEVVERSGRKINFVDGGYADNSGAATAAALYYGLKTHAALKNVRLRMIILTNEEVKENLSHLNGTELVDTKAPVQALLSVRSSLASREVNRAMERFNLISSGDPRTDWNVGVIRLDQSNFSLQLGWTISRTTHLVVSMFVARPEYCRSSDDDKSGSGTRRQPAAASGTQESTEDIKRRESIEDVKTIERNACFLRDVIRDLREGAPPLRLPARAN